MTLLSAERQLANPQVFKMWEVITKVSPRKKKLAMNVIATLMATRACRHRYCSCTSSIGTVCACLVVGLPIVQVTTKMTMGKKQVSPQSNIGKRVAANTPGPVGFWRSVLYVACEAGTEVGYRRK